MKKSEIIKQLKIDLAFKEREIAKLKSELYFTGRTFGHNPKIYRTNEEGYVCEKSYIDLVAEVEKLKAENKAWIESEQAWRNGRYVSEYSRLQQECEQLKEENKKLSFLNEQSQRQFK